MVDTIVLVLSRNMFNIADPDRFEPSARLVLGSKYFGGRGYITAKQNPTKSELKTGNYKPRLTLTKRINHTGKPEATLKVELSLPKLLFGNNFDELQDKDFNTVLIKLQTKLNEMGVNIPVVKLENAPVSNIHYSKNIPLANGVTPYHYITKIREANVSKALDTNQTDFRNEGHSYKFRTNTYEVAFYDKLKDLETAKKSGKRSIESDSIMQLDLFNNLRKQKPIEVLRMEVRLNNRQKLGQILRKVKIDSELTFKNLFKINVSRLILLYYLDLIEEWRTPLFDYESGSVKGALSDLIISNPNYGPRKILQLLGFKLALDEIGSRELRELLKGYSPKSWYRLIKESKEINSSYNLNVFNELRKTINDFIPLRLLDYEYQMINNDK